MTCNGEEEAKCVTCGGEEEANPATKLQNSITNLQVVTRDTEAPPETCTEKSPPPSFPPPPQVSILHHTPRALPPIPQESLILPGTPCDTPEALEVSLKAHTPRGLPPSPSLHSPPCSLTHTSPPPPPLLTPQALNTKSASSEKSVYRDFIGQMY